MSTLVRFRKVSSIQYIKVLNELTSHTSFYLDRLPKSTKFTWQTKLVSLVQDAYLDANRGYALRNFKTWDTFNKRKGYWENILENLACLDCFLSVLAQNPNYYSMITKDSENDYPWVHWGELIDEAKRLIEGVMKKDLERANKLSKS